MNDTGKLEILIADDEEELRRGLSLYFKKLNYAVTEAVSGLACIETIKEREQSGKPFDLIILDIIMPEATGVEVVDYVYQRELKTPILLMSGCFDIGLDEKYGKMAIELLHKPFDPSELIESVNAVLKSGI